MSFAPPKLSVDVPPRRGFSFFGGLTRADEGATGDEKQDEKAKSESEEEGATAPVTSVSDLLSRRQSPANASDSAYDDYPSSKPFSKTKSESALSLPAPANDEADAAKRMQRRASIGTAPNFATAERAELRRLSKGPVSLGDLAAYALAGGLKDKAAQDEERVVPRRAVTQRRRSTLDVPSDSQALQPMSPLASKPLKETTPRVLPMGSSLSIKTPTSSRRHSIGPSSSTNLESFGFGRNSPGIFSPKSDRLGSPGQPGSPKTPVSPWGRSPSSPTGTRNAPTTPAEVVDASISVFLEAHPELESEVWRMQTGQYSIRGRRVVVVKDELGLKTRRADDVMKTVYVKVGASYRVVEEFLGEVLQDLDLQKQANRGEKVGVAKKVLGRSVEHSRIYVEEIQLRRALIGWLTYIESYKPKVDTHIQGLLQDCVRGWSFLSHHHKKASRKMANHSERMTKHWERGGQSELLFNAWKLYHRGGQQEKTVLSIRSALEQAGEACEWTRSRLKYQRYLSRRFAEQLQRREDHSYLGRCIASWKMILELRKRHHADSLLWGEAKFVEGEVSEIRKWAKAMTLNSSGAEDRLARIGCAVEGVAQELDLRRRSPVADNAVKLAARGTKQAVMEDEEYDGIEDSAYDLNSPGHVRRRVFELERVSASPQGRRMVKHARGEQHEATLEAFGALARCQGVIASLQGDVWFTVRLRCFSGWIHVVREERLLRAEALVTQRTNLATEYNSAVALRIALYLEKANRRDVGLGMFGLWASLSSNQRAQREGERVARERERNHFMLVIATIRNRCASFTKKTTSRLALHERLAECHAIIRLWALFSMDAKVARRDDDVKRTREAVETSARAVQHIQRNTAHRIHGRAIACRNVWRLSEGFTFWLEETRELQLERALSTVKWKMRHVVNSSAESISYAHCLRVLQRALVMWADLLLLARRRQSLKQVGHQLAVHTAQFHGRRGHPALLRQTIGAWCFAVEERQRLERVQRLLNNAAHHDSTRLNLGRQTAHRVEAARTRTAAAYAFEVWLHAALQTQRERMIEAVEREQLQMQLRFEDNKVRIRAWQVRAADRYGRSFLLQLVKKTYSAWILGVREAKDLKQSASQWLRRKKLQESTSMAIAQETDHVRRMQKRMQNTASYIIPKATTNVMLTHLLLYWRWSGRGRLLGYAVAARIISQERFQYRSRIMLRWFFWAHLARRRKDMESSTTARVFIEIIMAWRQEASHRSSQRNIRRANALEVIKGPIYRSGKSALQQWFKQIAWYRLRDYHKSTFKFQRAAHQVLLIEERSNENLMKLVRRKEIISAWHWYMAVQHNTRDNQKNLARRILYTWRLDIWESLRDKKDKNAGVERQKMLLRTDEIRKQEEATKDALKKFHGQKLGMKWFQSAQQDSQMTAKLFGAWNMMVLEARKVALESRRDRHIQELTQALSEVTARYRRAADSLLCRQTVRSRAKILMSEAWQAWWELHKRYLEIKVLKEKDKKWKRDHVLYLGLMVSKHNVRWQKQQRDYSVEVCFNSWLKLRHKHEQLVYGYKRMKFNAQAANLARYLTKIVQSGLIHRLMTGVFVSWCFVAIRGCRDAWEIAGVELRARAKHGREALLQAGTRFVAYLIRSTIFDLKRRIFRIWQWCPAIRADFVLRALSFRAWAAWTHGVMEKSVEVAAGKDAIRDRDQALMEARAVQDHTVQQWRDCELQAQQSIADWRLLCADISAGAKLRASQLFAKRLALVSTSVMFREWRRVRYQQAVSIVELHISGRPKGFARRRALFVEALLSVRRNLQLQCFCAWVSVNAKSRHHSRLGSVLDNDVTDRDTLSLWWFFVVWTRWVLEARFAKIGDSKVSLDNFATEAFQTRNDALVMRRCLATWLRVVSDARRLQDKLAAMEALVADQKLRLDRDTFRAWRSKLLRRIAGLLCSCREALELGGCFHLWRSRIISARVQSASERVQHVEYSATKHRVPRPERAEHQSHAQSTASHRVQRTQHEEYSSTSHRAYLEQEYPSASHRAYHGHITQTDQQLESERLVHGESTMKISHREEKVQLSGGMGGYPEPHELENKYSDLYQMYGADQTPSSPISSSARSSHMVQEDYLGRSIAEPLASRRTEPATVEYASASSSTAFPAEGSSLYVPTRRTSGALSDPTHINRYVDPSALPVRGAQHRRTVASIPREFGEGRGLSSIEDLWPETGRGTSSMPLRRGT